MEIVIKIVYTNLGLSTIFKIVFIHSFWTEFVRGQSVTAWVAKLLGTQLSIQVHKKVKFSWQLNSPLALKGLI